MHRKGVSRQTLLLFAVAAGYKVVFTLASAYLHMEVFQGTDLTVYWNDAGILTGMWNENASTYFSYLFSGECPASGCPEFGHASQPRALLFSKIISIIRLLTADDIYVVSLYFSAAAFACAWFLYSRLVNYSASFHIPAAIAFLFYPSAVFWTSGLQKETLAVGLIFLVIALTYKWLLEGPFPQKWYQLLIAAMLVYPLWQLKYYYAAALVPLLVTTIVTRQLTARIIIFKRSRVAVFLVWFAILTAGLLTARMIHIALSFEHLLPLIVRTHEAVLQATSGPYHISMPGLEATLSSFGRYLPNALVAGLFRPLPADGANWLSCFAIAENSLLVILFLLSLVLFFKNRERITLAGIAILFYSMMLAAFLAYSLPNFGSLVRFKASFLPFFAFLLMIPVAKHLKKKTLTAGSQGPE